MSTSTKPHDVVRNNSSCVLCCRKSSKNAREKTQQQKIRSLGVGIKKLATKVVTKTSLPESESKAQ